MKFSQHSLPLALALLLFAAPLPLCAQQAAAPHSQNPPQNLLSAGKRGQQPAAAARLVGSITDSLGATLPHARVALLGPNGSAVAERATTGADGRYSFALAAPGRYRVRVRAAGFRPALSEAAYAASANTVRVDLVLFPSVVSQHLVVTATGVPTPQEQTGASISVIGQVALATRRSVSEELRLQPGAQLTSNGQIGGTTSLFVRGGPSNTTKVLIDGVAVNDVSFRYFNFANLNSEGFAKAEFFRGPDSALYGSDALSGVISLTTRRGTTPLPEIYYSVGGGSYGTLHQEASVGGAWWRWDYFADLARFDTQNSTPNSEYHNLGAVANLGYQLSPSTWLRATVRRSVSAFNSAYAIDLFGIADDGVTREFDTSFGVTLENNPSPRWHNLIRYGGLRFREPYVNFGPTGIPATDPYGSPIYLGKVMTIRGANGYQVTGQGILQYQPGSTQSSLLSDRDSIYAQTDYRWNRHLAALFGFRYEAEGGYSYDNIPYYAYLSKIGKTRGNYSYMLQLNGGFGDRFYYTVGSGLENNAVFGFAATPRASLAYHLVRPADQHLFSGTRLVFNFGKGVLEPSIYQESNSVYDLLQSLGDAQVIAQYGIGPLRAQLSRTYDGGVEQLLLRGRARVSFHYFHNEFGDQAEGVPDQALSLFGVPQAVINALGYGYAYINSLSYSSQGTELEAEYRVNHYLSVRGGWTWTDAVVQHSFSGLTGNAATNPNLPLLPDGSPILIGAYSPLNGARPFRIAPNTGYLAVDFHTSRLLLRLTGSMVSRRNDSTFLSDASYGNTMLLPNRNLDPAYQLFGLYGSFRFNRHLRVYSAMQNLLNQRYYEAFGYPALPFTIRSGMSFTFGGDSWKF